MSNPPASSARAAPPAAGSISGVEAKPAKQLNEASIINKVSPAILVINVTLSCLSTGPFFPVSPRGGQNAAYATMASFQSPAIRR
jgi:hypothetical protein